METFSALLAICAGNSPVTGEFLAQRSVTRSFDVFFDLRLKKCLSKQGCGWWFETPSRPLWRHCNAIWELRMKHHHLYRDHRSVCLCFDVYMGLIHKRQYNHPKTNENVLINQVLKPVRQLSLSCGNSPDITLIKVSANDLLSPLQCLEIDTSLFWRLHGFSSWAINQLWNSRKRSCKSRADKPSVNWAYNVGAWLPLLFEMLWECNLQTCGSCGLTFHHTCGCSIIPGPLKNKRFISHPTWCIVLIVLYVSYVGFPCGFISM